MKLSRKKRNINIILYFMLGIVLTCAFNMENFKIFAATSPTHETWELAWDTDNKPNGIDTDNEPDGISDWLSNFDYDMDNGNYTFYNLKLHSDAEDVYVFDHAMYNGHEYTLTTNWRIMFSENTTIKYVHIDSVAPIMNDATLDNRKLYQAFEKCTNLQEIYFSANVDTSNMTNFGRMFHSCESLQYADLSHLDFSNAVNFEHTFYQCKKLATLNLNSTLTASKVTNMEGMFYGCEVLPNVDVSNWSSENLKNFKNSFRDCKTMTTLQFGSAFTTEKVTNMENTFYGCESLSTLDISNFHSTKLTTMKRMFSGCTSLTSIIFNNDFTASSVTSMEETFCNSAVSSLNLSKFNTSNVTTMYKTFSSCNELESIEFGSGWTTANVLTMDHCFFYDAKLSSLNLSTFDSTALTDATSMFHGCVGLTSITFGENFTLSNATKIGYLFNGCSKLTELNLSTFNLSSVETYEYAFSGCSKLTKIYLPVNIKQGVSIPHQKSNFLPYTDNNLLISDITDTTNLLSQATAGASGTTPSYLMIAPNSDIKLRAINVAATDADVYTLLTAQDFSGYLQAGDNKTAFINATTDQKKFGANYIYNRVHGNGSNPYTSFDDMLNDFCYSMTTTETITYTSLQVSPGEKGSFKISSALLNTDEITANYEEDSTPKSITITPDTNYETIEFDPSITYTFKKTLKNSTLFTDPLEIGALTFTLTLTLSNGDITFDGGPFTYDGQSHSLSPVCSKYTSAIFTTTYYIKGNAEPISNLDVVNAGTYVCEATLISPDFINGVKTASTEFTISSLSMTDNANITLDGYDASVPYNATAYKPSSLTVKWSGNVVNSADYDITYGDNINAGNGTITVTGKRNFTGYKTFTFTITKRNITNNNDIVVTNLNDAKWTGSQITPDSFTVLDNGIIINNSSKTLTKNTDYSITSYGTNTDIGDDEGSVEITGIGNYEGTKTFTFNIVSDTISELSRITVSVNDTSLVYSGSALTPSANVSVKLDGTPLTSSNYEIVGWENNIDANMHNGATKAKVKVKLKGDYSSDVVEKTFNIYPKELTSTDFTYSGPVITKNVSEKSDYNDTIPQSEKNKIAVNLTGDTNTKLNFTEAKFVGINASDNPKKFGNTSIILTGLSTNNTNYKIADSFTSYTIASSNGLLVDKIKPELDDDWVAITSGVYKAGDDIEITLNFDKNIVKSGTDPILEFYSTNYNDGSIGTLQGGRYVAKPTYVSTSGKSVTFKYEVKEGDYIPNGFTFKLSGINNYTSLKDELGNEITYTQKEKRFDQVKVLSADVIFTNIINTIQGNKNKNDKKNIILNILIDNDQTDLIFDTPANNDLKSSIGRGSVDNTLKDYVAGYLSNITLVSNNKRDELLNEMRKAIELKQIEDDIRLKLTTYPSDKAIIDSCMINYQKLSANQKKNFSQSLKEQLENLYYGNLTADYKYKDSPQGEANEIEIYGIVSRTSAGSNPVQLQVVRINDMIRINELQKMINDNTSSVVSDPLRERVIAPYDIKVVTADTKEAVTIPGDKVLCRINLPKDYYGKITNIYHKIDNSTLEKVENVIIELLNNETVIYFECDSFSPYFITSDVISVKASIDNDGMAGTVSPLGLITKESGQSQKFTFQKNTNVNRVDITILEYNNDEKNFKQKENIEPINLNKNNSFTLTNITANTFITFKFSFDETFKEEPKNDPTPSGGGGGGTSITIGHASYESYMQGYEDGTFKPQEYITRAEAATVIARISGSYSDKADYTSYASNYTDVISKMWYTNYIGYVTSKKIMCGDEGGFRPNDNITRGEFAKLIYKLAESSLSGTKVTKEFNDVEGKFYKDYTNILYSANLLNGYEDGSFKGENPLTRTEACIMINNLTGRGKDKTQTLKNIKASKDFKSFKDVDSNRWFYLDVMMATVSYTEQ